MAYTPILGGAAGAPFDLQFGQSQINPISLSCTLIEQLSNDGTDKTVSHGSGCFWRHNGSPHLLTARHVLTGRSPFDDAILSTSGYIPQKIVVYPAVEFRPGQWIRGKVALNLNHEEPNWLQDPEFNTLRTDIAALAINLDPSVKVLCLNDMDGLDNEIFTKVGMECSVVGYPTTSFGGLMTPIWRTGSIASEPSLPVDGKPMFLLDAATSPGFSGSPVFRQHFGSLPVQQPDGSINILADRVITTSFVGIYAGRLQHQHVGGEVPFIFYGNRVPRLFEQAT